MNSVLSKIIESGYTNTPDDNLIKVNSAISQREGNYLSRLISKFKPIRSLEIGLAYGVSALYICDALEKTANTKHIIIDPNQFGGNWGTDWNGIGILNLNNAGYESIIDFYNMTSYEALPLLAKDNNAIDFAFIDGWHTFDYALVDFFYIDKMLKVGGIIVLDDANWPSINKLCCYIITNLNYSVINGPKLIGKSNLKRQRQTNHSILSYLHEIAVIYFRAIILLIRKINPKQRKLLSGMVDGCIAFKKESEDTRKWNFHYDF